MNHTLHHFHKEVLHIRKRWMLWLCLLVIQLVVNLEWILPLPWELTLETTGWSSLLVFCLHWIVLGVALWLVAACAPEDHPASTERFLGVRPLPMRSYFLARCLTFAVLIVLPFAVQECIYLALSGRPAGDIVVGAMEAGMRAIAWLGWWIPFSILWRRKRESWYAAATAAVTLVIAFIVRVWLEQTVFAGRSVTGPDPFPAYQAAGVLHGMQSIYSLTLGMLLLSLIAALHLKFAWRLVPRLAVVTVIALAVISLWALVSLPSPAFRPTAQSEVDAIASRMCTNFTTLRANDVSAASGSDARLWLVGEAQNYPAEFTPHWRRQEVTLEKNGVSVRTRGAGMQEFVSAFGSWQNLPIQPAVASFFPKGLVCNMPPGSNIERGIDAGTLPIPDAWKHDDGPIRAHGTFAIDWLRWEKVVELPLIAGREASGKDSRWSLRSVGRASKYHSGFSHVLDLVVQVDVRQQRTSPHPWLWYEEYVPLIYAPDHGFLQVKRGNEDSTNPAAAVSSYHELGFRAKDTSWQRWLVWMNWAEVLQPKGPVAVEDMKNLRLVVLRRTYAGTSTWQGSLPDLKLPAVDRSLVMRGDSMQDESVLLARLKEIEPLKEGADIREVEAWLASVLDVLSPFYRRPWSQEVTDQIVAVLKSLATSHPEMLLRMDHGERLSPLTDLFADNPQVQAAIAAKLPEEPWLADMIYRRPAWQEALRPQAASLMEKVSLQQALWLVEMFMSWRDPAHVPWLLKVAEDNANPKLYLYCRSFPEHRDAADAMARRVYQTQVDANSIKLVQQKNGVPDFRPLAMGLRAGMPEALQQLLRILKSANMREHELMVMSYDLTDCFGRKRTRPDSREILTSDARWLTALGFLKPEQFRFDAENRVWLRTDTDINSPAPPSR